MQFWTIKYWVNAFIKNNYHPIKLHGILLISWQGRRPSWSQNQLPRWRMKGPRVVYCKNISTLPDGSAAVDSFEDLRFDRAITRTTSMKFCTPGADKSKLKWYLLCFRKKVIRKSTKMWASQELRSEFENSRALFQRYACVEVRWYTAGTQLKMASLFSSVVCE